MLKWLNEREERLAKTEHRVTNAQIHPPKDSVTTLSILPRLQTRKDPPRRQLQTPVNIVSVRGSFHCPLRQPRNDIACAIRARARSQFTPYFHAAHRKGYTETRARESLCRALFARLLPNAREQTIIKNNELALFHEGNALSGAEPRYATGAKRELPSMT